MERLNLLKPDVRTGYLEGGKGQEVTYLSISENITVRDLEWDIRNGAAQYQEVLDFVKKKPSRFVIINCNNEEEGLTAVSYLSAAYNKIEGLCSENYGDSDEDVSDEMDISFEDYDSYDDDSFSFGDDDDKDIEDDDSWQENPWRIPVIRTSQLMGDDDDFLPFGSGGVNYGRRSNPRNRIPYWYNTRKESICIIHPMYCGYIANPFINTSLVAKLRRYANNRHVFIVVVTDKKVANLNMSDDSFSSPEKNVLCEVILEYSSATIQVSCEDAVLQKHHVNLFENWIDRYGYSLARKFPSRKIVSSIVGMNNPDKSALLEKVIKYVIKDEDIVRELKEEDFKVLSKFKALGADLTKSDHENIKKIKDNLVGMDDVKEQIMGIVEVMRYNKRRAAMGLNTGNYHNVHMMLGAPGTAKTTVAEMLGNIMAEEHLLDGSRFIAVNGAELKGMYVGHSAPKVKALFDEYNVIFIDEAYAVAAGQDGESDSFSQEAIAQLIIELEAHGMDRLVMFAGYGGSKVSEKDNKMKKFLQSNPGIRSRINSTIYFESYTADEMVDIFRCHAKIGQFTISKRANAIVREFFAERVERSDFGNGREARSLLENSMVQAAKRLANVPDGEITDRMMKEITVEDIKKAIERMRLGTTMQLGNTARVGFV